MFCARFGGNSVPKQLVVNIATTVVVTVIVVVVVRTVVVTCNESRCDYKSQSMWCYQLGVRSPLTTMSSPPSLAPFVRALLNDIENNEAPRNKSPLLGMARRYETKKTKWDRPARLVLRALILHAPDPESMTREFWQALRKGENATILSHCQWHYVKRYDQLIDTWPQAIQWKRVFFPLMMLSGGQL